MFAENRLATYRQRLDPRDVDTFGPAAAAEAERFLRHRENYAPTPLHALPGLARALGVGAIHVKDEAHRLGLGSFKALGGAYAVIRLGLEAAAERLGRPVDIGEMRDDAVRAVTAAMIFACATDGNHGRSVAQGAQLLGAKAMIFVHSGVSEERAAAIARFGAQIVRVVGTYDDSVAEASRVASANGWTVVSDTSWPGYERIPALVMQGYAVLMREAMRALPERPTHVFVQAGVGGIAAAVAGYLEVELAAARPVLTVVEPDRAACLYASAQTGHPVKIEHGEPTVMAMLECYEPSLVAWRVLARVADAFMTVGEQDAVDAMKRLARPVAGDPAIVAGESGGVGLAGLIAATRQREIADALGLGPQSRVFLINTEGATDPQRYAELVG